MPPRRRRNLEGADGSSRTDRSDADRAGELNNQNNQDILSLFGNVDEHNKYNEAFIYPIYWNRSSRCAGFFRDRRHDRADLANQKGWKGFQLALPLLAKSFKKLNISMLSVLSRTTRP